MLLNKEQVLNFLPHRDPFLFIDSVSSVTVPEGITELQTVTSKDLVGSHVIANFHVREGLEILKGHFPGNPILPGVVQIEMMAQSSAFVGLALEQNDSDGVQVQTLLLGADNAKFRKPILPGMDLEIHAILEKARGPMATYKCEIFCEGTKVSQVNIFARLLVSKKD